MKKGVIRNFTGKYMCQSLFVDKVAGLRPRALLQRYFPVNLSKFLRTPFHRTPPDDCFCLEQTRQLVLSSKLINWFLYIGNIFR